MKRYFRNGYPASYILRLLAKGYLVYRKSKPCDCQYWCTEKHVDSKWKGHEFICVISDQAWKTLVDSKFIYADSRDAHSVYYKITPDGEEHLESLLSGRQRTRPTKQVRIRTRV